MNKVSCNHPCYSKQAHQKYARLHLPVAKNCNLNCNYCERLINGTNYHIYRPGSTKKILTPDEAIDMVEQVNKTGVLTVAGIAGPGEPLYNEETFTTFTKIKQKYPSLLLCLSSNGLLIEKKINLIKELNIDSISITINSFSIDNLIKIYNSVITDDGVVLINKEAAGYIREKQIAALNLLYKYKIEFKVNTILIPGINDYQIEEIAQTLNKYHTVLHNIVKFIPMGELKNYPAADCKQLKDARQTAEKYVPQFYLCKQCSADAFELPSATCCS